MKPCLRTEISMTKCLEERRDVLLLFNCNKTNIAASFICFLLLINCVSTKDCLEKNVGKDASHEHRSND